MKKHNKLIFSATLFLLASSTDGIVYAQTYDRAVNMSDQQGGSYRSTLRDNRSARYREYRARHHHASPHPKDFTNELSSAHTSSHRLIAPPVLRTTRSAPITDPVPSLTVAQVHEPKPLPMPAPTPLAATEPAPILAPEPTIALNPPPPSPSPAPVIVMDIPDAPSLAPMMEPRTVERMRPIGNPPVDTPPAPLPVNVMPAPLTPPPAVPSPYNMTQEQLRSLPVAEPTAATLPQENASFTAPSNDITAPTYNDSSSPIATAFAGLEGHIATSYRVDTLDWNIASDLTGTTTPNILSELEWKDIKRYQITSGASYTLPTTALAGLHLEGEAAHASAFAGDNRDSDYASDNRENEFSRSSSDSGDGEALSVQAAIGYQFDLTRDSYNTSRKTTITPVIGYAVERQDFTMKDGYQEIPATGHFAGLNSSYDTSIKAPFIGIRAEYGNSVDSISASLDYLRGDYEADANWNLRDTFRHPNSFHHDTDISGWKFGFNFRHELMEGLGFIAIASIQRWSGTNGVDTLYMSDGSISSSRLNEVNWQSQSYGLGLNYQW